MERYNRNAMLDRDTLIGALKRLRELLQAREVEGEICLLGGAVMVLASNARPSTKDVDATLRAGISGTSAGSGGRPRARPS